MDPLLIERLIWVRYKPMDINILPPQTIQFRATKSKKTAPHITCADWALNYLEDPVHRLVPILDQFTSR